MRSLHTRWRQLRQPTLFRWKLTRLSSVLPRHARLPLQRLETTDWTNATPLALIEARPAGAPGHDAAAILARPRRERCEQARRPACRQLPQRGPGPPAGRPPAGRRRIPSTALDVLLAFPQLAGGDTAPAALPRNQVLRIALASLALSVSFGDVEFCWDLGLGLVWVGFLVFFPFL